MTIINRSKKNSFIHAVKKSILIIRHTLKNKLFRQLTISLMIVSLILCSPSVAQNREIDNRQFNLQNIELLAKFLVEALKAVEGSHDSAIFAIKEGLLSKRLKDSGKPYSAEDIRISSSLFSQRPDIMQRLENVNIEKWVADARVNFPNSPLLLLPGLNLLALKRVLAGRYADAEVLYKEAKDIVQNSILKDGIHLPKQFNRLASSYQLQGRYQEAESLLTRSLSMARTLLKEDDVNLPIFLNDTALIYDVQGRFNEAEPLYLESLKISRELMSRRLPDSLDPELSKLNLYVTLTALANSYIFHGRYAEAEKLRKELKDLRIDPKKN